MKEEDFVRGLRALPDDDVLRLVYADWLAERRDPRGELLHLTHLLTHSADIPERQASEARVRFLATAGVPPIGPRFTNSLGMQFTWVPPGTFRMGSAVTECERQDDETAQPVTLTKGYYLGVHPVTQAQWQAVMGSNPSRFEGDALPVESVSWEDCQEFCALLNRKDGLSSAAYRLPTEAEWEHACRTGTSSPFFLGETLTTNQANFHSNFPTVSGPKAKYRAQTTPVGSFVANALGLFDMHGNVFEWCADWYGPYVKPSGEDPEGPGRGDARVVRGGSWHSLVWRCRSACRGWAAPVYRGSDVGCRICYRLDFDYAI